MLYERSAAQLADYHARGDAAWRVDEYAAAPEAAEDARSALRRWRAARARRENEKSI